MPADVVGRATTKRPALALEGGAPVRQRYLPYSHHSIEDDDIAAVVAVLRSDWLTTGPVVEAFEHAFAAHVGAKHAIAVSSGTAALHAAAFAAQIGPGDEVVVPPLTFVASANCVRYQGARVVFADVRADTLTLDPRCVEAAVTPQTRAIITVDYGGQPSDLEELRVIAGRFRLTLIEDASHACGATYRGRSVGSLADLTTFSLHPAKPITSGEGGVVTTDDPDVAARLRRVRNHCISVEAATRQRQPSWWYDVEELGYNYRLTDLQCALAMSQLKKLPKTTARRRAIAGRYAEAFGHLTALELPTTLPDRESAWHLYPVRLHLDRVRVDRETVFRALRAENIGVNVHYIPVPWHPYYQRLGYAKGAWPVAEAAYERLLSLPMWAGMSEADLDDVIAAVTNVLSRWGR